MRKFSVPNPKKGSDYYHKGSDYRELYGEYWGAIQKFAYGNTKDYHKSEDIAQEVMLQIFKRWEWIQWDRLPAAISVITHNTMIDMHRAEKGNSNLILMEDELTFECHDDGLTDPIKFAIEQESIKGLYKMSESFGEHDEVLFNEIYINGMDVKDYLEKYKVMKSAIYQRLHRLRKKVVDYASVHDMEYQWKCLN